MASEQKPITFQENDCDDFNLAFSLLYAGSSVETTGAGDDGVHLRNVCRVSLNLLNDIRNRHRPSDIELTP